MKKLSFDDLVKKADTIASDELLNTIAGGTRGKGGFNSCHGNNCHPMAAADPSPEGPKGMA
ncbi:hypothetical protein [Aureivirga marina]|uniref:hypothetical protein n=1 Tax=Aureivirga marina TaxID=1182451 RepID=UPI0018CB1D87|nr:hypothetical protein [Aureivirga marina]